jgi:hypothetical protein
MEFKALPHLEIAQQIGEKPTLHPIHANIELVSARRGGDRVGPRLVLPHRVNRQERHELPRLEIELIESLCGEFKMETSGGFRQQKSARQPRSISWP